MNAIRQLWGETASRCRTSFRSMITGWKPLSSRPTRATRGREPSLVETELVQPQQWARKPALDALVGYFLGACQEARGVVIAGPNGIPIASTLPPEERIQLIAVTTMANLAAWAGSAVAANLRLPGMSGVTIEGPPWKVIVAPTPTHSAAVLVTMDKSADPAQINAALPSFLREVERTLESATSEA